MNKKTIQLYLLILHPLLPSPVPSQKMNPLLPYRSFFLFYIITLILILAPSPAFAIFDHYLNCSRMFTCGNIDNIGYPFWGSDRPKYCGFPGFELNCSGTVPEITISSVTYQVLQINNESHSLTVARADYVNNLCPTLLINTTLTPDLFEYSADAQNVILYYGCPTVSNQTTGLSSRFNCNVNGTTFSSYYLTRNFSGLAGDPIVTAITSSLGSCDGRVVLAANQSEIWSIEASLSPSSETLVTALSKGFGLQWNANNSLCDQCSESGGKCGYGSDLNKFSCFCTDQPYDSACPLDLTTPSGKLSSNWRLKLFIGGATGIFALAITFIAFFFALKKNSSSILKTLNPGQIRKRKKISERVEAFILELGNSLAPKRFSYSDVKKVTNSFSENLGQGGYGSVYKGTLPDGRFVAVKVLKKSKGDGQEFINEVASISRTSHVNVVTLLGFCYQGSKSALIYEYMPNGSLDKFIYNQESLEKNHQLDIKTLYEIAVGIAQGLEYLHKGCNTRILHFDIKPHNILLDKSFCPKISDFGLAKLCETRDTIVSITGGARGTCGYIAPEIICRNFGGVSYKSDVYSYGMMVLESIGARKKVNAEVSHSSEIYFPSWIYKQIEKAEKLNLDRVVDEEEEEEMTRKMVMVSLWCIQTIPSNRPSMTKVLEMLQGSLEALALPPEPLLSSPGPAVRSPQNSSSASSVIMQVVSEQH